MSKRKQHGQAKPGLVREHHLFADPSRVSLSGCNHALEPKALNGISLPLTYNRGCNTKQFRLAAR